MHFRCSFSVPSGSSMWPSPAALPAVAADLCPGTVRALTCLPVADHRSGHCKFNVAGRAADQAIVSPASLAVLQLRPLLVQRR